MATPTLLLGGFLGAGKTTLLAASAVHLASSGKRSVAVLCNDLADGSIDTACVTAGAATVASGEVSGSCFCCNFPALLSTARELRATLADDGRGVLLCEPVGSCTDLSATVLQPMKARHADEFEMKPLSVLVDAARLRPLLAAPGAAADVAGGALPEGGAYIARKQLEEADVVLVSKADLLGAEERRELAAGLARLLPGRGAGAVRFVSATSGEGVAEWLEWALAATAEQAGTRLAKMDYEVYAAGEAAFGWVNAEWELTTAEMVPVDGEVWGAFVAAVMDAVHAQLQQRQRAVGHVKALLTGAGSYYLANLVGLGAVLSKRGKCREGAGPLTLLVNGRVQGSPQELEAWICEGVSGALEGEEFAALRAELKVSRSLVPGRPEPTFRALEIGARG